MTDRGRWFGHANPREAKQLEVGLERLLDQVVPGWHGSCSVDYVRGREAGEAVLVVSAVIANCNEVCTLQEGD